MTRFCGFLIDGLSRLVEPAAKDAVIGDLAELNLGWPRTVYELCGLIVRQQAPLWKEWRPWLALLGVVGLVGLRLSFLAARLNGTPFIYLRTYLKYGTRYESGLSLGEESITWLSLALAVGLWSWTAGFAFTLISRKTAFFTGLVLCMLWLIWNGVLLARIPWNAWLLLLVLPWLFFFLPAVRGARRAFRQGNLSGGQAIALLAVIISVIALVTWTSGWPQAGVERWSEGAIGGGTPWYRRMVPYLLLSWPAIWIAMSSDGGLGFWRSKYRTSER